MNFRDTWATNEAGEKFIFTVEMQRNLHEAGLPVEVASLNKKSTGAETPQEQKTVAEPEPAYEAAAVKKDKPARVVFDEPTSIQIDPETGKYIGRVRWFDEAKDGGMLYRGSGKDVFFHKTDIICDPSDLAAGVWILYDVEKVDRGLEASEVELYSK